MKFACYTLLVFTALFAACERVDVPANKTSGSQGLEGESASQFGAPPATQSLFQRIANSRQVTTFQGVRRVELFVDEGAVQHHSVLRERVSADGHGAFAIESLELIEPPMSNSQHALFIALQSLRQGMNWRYRDFSIHDVGLFLQNYRVTDTGVLDVVAGHPVIELLVERVDQSGSLYTLLVDSATGLVLKAHEESQEHVLISEMCYESLELAPDLSGVVWHQELNNEEPLPAIGPLTATVGFEPLVARALPAGFQLLERTSVIEPLNNSKWVKATFTDGVENLFFLHGGPIVGDNGIKSGLPEIEADLVEVTVAAPWTVARGNLRTQRVIALGKVSEADLLHLLRSALE